jgi:5-formyltetrahydrofolate cyclo-ligase
LRESLAKAGVRVLLPVVLPDGVLDWTEDAGEANQLPSRGIGGPEPIGPRLGPEAVREVDVMLIPALAVDTLGRRLGQGVGYYDRVLAMLSPAIPVIALVHEEEVLDAAVEPIPTEPHDLPVHAVATPRRCLRVR